MTEDHFVVKVLSGGARPTFTTFSNVDGPLMFERSSAAYAWLIDKVNALGAQRIMQDEDDANPGCFDVLVDFGNRIEQYAVERL